MTPFSRITPGCYDAEGSRRSAKLRSAAAELDLTATRRRRSSCGFGALGREGASELSILRRAASEATNSSNMHSSYLEPIQQSQYLKRFIRT
jgi:hypothetical protein